MRFCELCDREVVNINDCRSLGCVKDVELDIECGDILAIIVPGPCRYFGCFGRECEFFIPWVKIIRIGPDIILVNFNEQEMRRNMR